MGGNKMKLKAKLSASFLLLTLLCQLFLATACSSKVRYLNDIPCYDISEAFIHSQSASDGYSYYKRDEISFFLELPDYVNDFSVVYSTDVNDINEIGVFHCADEKSAEEFFSVISAYLKEQQTTQRAFIESYAPHEVPKLEGAEARQYGNYVVYTILSAEDKKAVWELTDKKLRG
jgi:hypothetical protein